MANPDQIAQTLVGNYYQTFDTNRANLGSLYAPNAQLQFEGKHLVGPEAIIQHLVNLPFQKVAHSVTTCDNQMTIDSGLLVFVIGKLKTDEDPIHSFTEVFHLKQVGDSLFIVNQMFRLGLHHS